MFDYKGYSEAKLLKLCNEEMAHKGFSDWKYWTSEVYSYGKHIREYGFYPPFLPLYIYTDHGADGVDEIIDHELQTDAPHMLFHYIKKVKNFKKKSQKPVNCLISPFVYYRRRNKIQNLKTAKGTLVFHVHSTPEIDLSSNNEEYIEELKKLPEEFHPICICMHMHDIYKGAHKIFLEHGFPVYTAGNAFDQRFAERFYGILKNFKYSMSNFIGSHAFYSIELGIPFLLYGSTPVLINKSDPNLKNGEYKYIENSGYKESYDLFSGWKKEITEEQKAHVEECLGVKNSISRLELTKILYTTYLKKGNLIKDLLFAINYYRKFLKKKIKGEF